MQEYYTSEAKLAFDWASKKGTIPSWWRTYARHFAGRCYPAWEDGWPHQEAHFNSRYSWANAEFTPRQTMRGKMLLYAYLYSIFR